MRTLVLNASYEPLQVIDWQRAIYMVHTNKAIIVSEYDKVIRSPSTEMNLPKVIRLTKYVKVFDKLNNKQYSKYDVHKRDDYVCQYCEIKCKKANATIDHVIPRALGGKSTWENTVTCCKSCNSSKGSMTLAQSGMKLLRKPKKPAVWQLLKKDLLAEEFDL